jgi:hypothetical protein
MDLLTPVAHDANEARRPVTAGIEGPVLASGWGPARPEDPARELDAEVALLLRVRGGELAQPLAWLSPSHRSEVETIVSQLAPIRSRLALLSSWARESRQDSPVRLAYAITWLRLAQRRAGEYGPPRRGSRAARLRTSGAPRNR